MFPSHKFATRLHYWRVLRSRGHASLIRNCACGSPLRIPPGYRLSKSKIFIHPIVKRNGPRTESFIRSQPAWLNWNWVTWIQQYTRTVLRKEINIKALNRGNHKANLEVSVSLGKHETGPPQYLLGCQYRYLYEGLDEHRVGQLFYILLSKASDATTANSDDPLEWC